MANQKIVLDQIKMSSTKVLPPKGKKSEGLCSSMYISYPQLYTTTKQVPDLAGKEAGDVVTMLVKGKITNHSINSNMTSDGKDSNKRESHDIQITSVGLVKE